MPKPFYNLSLEQFEETLYQFPFKRRLNAVHLHHTFRPNHSQYNGLASIEAMWRFHTQTKGLSDIAAHLIVAPDGKIWTGRSWNQPPVSAVGHNGNTAAGPFMISAIGDFSVGGDPFEGRQREVVLQIIAQVQRLFKLPVESLYLHSQMSTQTCPGETINYTKVITAIGEIRAKLEEGKPKTTRRKGVDESPFSLEAREESGEVQKIIELFSRDLTGRADPVESELDHTTMSDEDIRLLTGQEGLVAPLSDRAGGEYRPKAVCDPTSPAIRAALRPHVINLSQGQFSDTGQYNTSPSDVDAIFGEHLEQALATAKQNKEKLRLLFYAHGGLVSEADGLRMAYKHIPWWLDNKIYPIYFVWETGFCETLGQLLSSAQQRALPDVSRDIFDFTTDPIIEAAVRCLGGVQFWAGVKRSAERAVLKPGSRSTTSAGAGGAYYVAKKLKTFCDKYGDAVELHAIGHSAGSVFHAHFLSTALDLGTPAFRSVHFLAPAIPTDEFSRLLAPRMGHGIDDLTIFTMAKDYELADNCASIYRKSVLYLLYYAMEAEVKTPILGLEESLRSNEKLARLFGLNGFKSNVGRVVFAVSSTETGRSASAATSHIVFDDDKTTMNSILRRILDLDDTTSVRAYPEEVAREVDYWRSSIHPMKGSRPLTTPDYSSPTQLQPAVIRPVASGLSQAGRRRALCVGIDAYRVSPLNGCVADAEMWAATFKQLGFQITILRNNEATYDGILKTLGELVDSSQPGDVVVFQYAGHGTQVKDINQDEQAGDSPQMDEALCPYDFDQGHLLIDDDVASVFSRIPAGVDVTCFIDCCHSGTITRFVVGLSEQTVDVALDERPRYIVADAALEAAHQRFRENQPRSRSAGARGPSTMKEVLFSACKSNEVAWESNGHGDFTIRATPILSAGLAGLTNETFQQRVTEAFGPNPRQHPELDCAPATKTRGLLQPLNGSTPATATDSRPTDGLEVIAQGLKFLADILTQRK